MKTSEIKGGWLTVNRMCNMRCPWCYASAVGYAGDASMPPDLAKHLVDLFYNLGVTNMIILGGEPTIYPHLEEIIRYSVDKNIRPIIVTNGRAFANQAYASSLLSTGLRDLTISLKAVEEDGYSLLAVSGQSGLFNEVCTAIKNTQTLGYKLNISVTLVRSLYDKLHDLVDLLSSFGPCHVTIDMGSPVVTPNGMDPKGILDPLELSRALTVLHGLLRTTSVDYSYYVSIPLCILDQCTRESMIKEGRILTTCHVPKGSGLIFTPDGSVILCNHFSSFPIAKYGVDFNTAEEFAAFWYSDRVKEVRSRVTTYPHPNCRDCTDWNICGGGCFVKWLQWDPNDYIVKKERR